jgi:hypothetical protein
MVPIEYAYHKGLNSNSRANSQTHWSKQKSLPRTTSHSRRETPYDKTTKTRCNGLTVRGGWIHNSTQMRASGHRARSVVYKVAAFGVAVVKAPAKSYYSTYLPTSRNSRKVSLTSTTYLTDRLKIQHAVGFQCCPEFIGAGWEVMASFSIQKSRNES